MREKLSTVLQSTAPPVVAVSGGVDSLTLAALAAEVVPDTCMVHAVSPAVPAEATARVRRLADQRAWHLEIIGAGEFDDPRYRTNPVNRCFFCKDHLYGAIRARSDRQILSGANLDDLGEYRPGLDAARRYGVRHPYIEAAFDKQAVRRLSRELGLGYVAELPAAPCLSSRVETGIPIESRTLQFVHAVETRLAEWLRPATIRCRVRAGAIVVELDAASLAELDAARRQDLAAVVAAHPLRPANLPVLIAPYRSGSAFLTAGGRHA